MNNKGFAITSIIYGLMILFVMVVASFLSVLVGRNRRMDDLLEGVRETLDYPVINVNYNPTDSFFYIDGMQAYSSQGAYVTDKRGQYSLTFNNETPSCTVYLPKNTVIVYGNYFDSSIYSEKKFHHYIVIDKDDGTKEEKYTELCP